MTHRHSDPWGVWYEAYLADRATVRAALRLARERRRAANVMVALLLAYMLVGGALASVAVRLVMAN